MKRKIIVASHGELSKGLVDTAKMILGSVNADLKSYCLKPGINADDFAKEVKAEILNEPETEFVILTDLYGASVCTAMTSLLAHSKVHLFTGMNINMLLSICVEYPQRLSDEDVMKIVHDAKEGIRSISAVDLESETEDF